VRRRHELRILLFTRIRIAQRYEIHSDLGTHLFPGYFDRSGFAQPFLTTLPTSDLLT
jgi:hypothetical protein